jgi:hypothetical protein
MATDAKICMLKPAISCLRFFLEIKAEIHRGEVAGGYLGNNKTRMPRDLIKSQGKI